ncbi:MAG: alkaline phosphatase family protein [Chloroflexota bacterium]|nr:alkaline phosphatase family protein [Chloroflexota bacterium]
MDFQDYFNRRQSRRRVLQQLGTLASVSLVLDACGPGTSPAPRPTSSGPGSINSIQHIVIACQENRSFDEYFGYYPRAGQFGVPANFSLPDGKGGTVKPFHFTHFDTANITHIWQAIHKEWDNGKMDGFFMTDGNSSLGYYTGSDIPYYYALADAFTLCGNYFSYQLGSTLPNRLALWAGTSGGITMNHRVPSGSLTWPTIVDLLEDHGITWKCYNLGTGLGSVPEVEFFNALPFFKRWYKDSRLHGREKDYYNDLKAGTLPQVTFLISDAFTSEHPPLSVRQGELKMAEVINALISSSLWTRSVLFLTYDEGGGFFDHVPPPQFDAYGPGMRVPTLVISPWVKRGYVSGQLYEHNSLLKFIERRFGLPTVASVNHLFDVATPAMYNDLAQGKTSGPPAPPRDGLEKLGDFYEVFDFSQNPNYFPKLPTKF